MGTKTFCDGCGVETSLLYVIEPRPNENARIAMQQKSIPPFAAYDFCGTCVEKMVIAVRGVETPTEAAVANFSVKGSVAQAPTP